jgi:uncharacterized membrane protein
LFEQPWLSRIADDVPDIATLLLVLIGILLAAVPLSKSLEKWFEDRPRVTMMIVATRIVIGGLGFYFNRKQRQKASQTIEHVSGNNWFKACATCSPHPVC